MQWFMYVSPRSSAVFCLVFSGLFICLLYLPNYTTNSWKQNSLFIIQHLVQYLSNNNKYLLNEWIIQLPFSVWVMTKRKIGTRVCASHSLTWFSVCLLGHRAWGKGLAVSRCSILFELPLFINSLIKLVWNCISSFLTVMKMFILFC